MIGEISPPRSVRADGPMFAPSEKGNHPRIFSVQLTDENVISAACLLPIERVRRAAGVRVEIVRLI
jgi:hypothetical protein